MAANSPPCITVEETERVGKTGPEVKKSLESLLSRSDSGSADEVEESELQAVLSVPSNKPTEGRGTGKGRKISVNDALKEMEAIKEGYLDRAGRFQRWNKKYLRIVGDHLYLSKTPEDKLCEDITLKNANVAENSTKNVNHSFSVITPYTQVVFAAATRKGMEEWMTAFRVASLQTPNLDILQHLEGQHAWFSCSHHRRTYCNVCRESLHGMAWHGLSCEVCKMKSHRRCVFQLKEKCKWTTRSSLEQANIKIEQDYSIPHMWVEGNLSAGSKCIVCQRPCGSVHRLQDFRCVWCKWTVHTECQEKVDKKCTLGDLQLSILPPSALQRSDAIRKGMWEPYKMVGHSPVLALVNSKSGDNQGVKFLRKLKYWLNPVQVFDLAISGPDLGLQLFQRFEKFRIIVFGGDGSLGWVLSAVDKFNLHSKTMVGVVPLGTGNDMARVMGWGSQFNDEEKLPAVLKEMEFSSFHLLDRWSIQYSRGDVDMSPIAEASASIPPKIYRSPLLLPRTLEDSSPLPGPYNNGHYSCVNGHDLAPADALDRSGFEVCELPDSSVDVCNLSPPQSDPGMELGHTTGSLESFNSIVSDLTQILFSQDEASVISSAQRVSQVVSLFVSSVLEDRKKKLTTTEYNNDPLVQQCTVLQQKLKGLQCTLQDEANAATEQQQQQNQLVPVQGKEGVGGGGGGGESGKLFIPRDALMARANSLKKAVQNVLDMTEKEVDAQAEVTAEVNTLMQPVQEESGLHTSPNVSICSSASSIDSGRLDAGPQSLDFFEQRSSMDSGRPSIDSGPCSLDMSRTRGSIDSGRRSLELGLHDMHHRSSTDSGPSARQGRPSLTSLMSVVEPAPVLRETKEVSCMNNYFGIGLDAQIAYQFHNTREKNQIKSRTKNKMLYGILGGKEFFANSQKYLERKISLECDGNPVTLPTRLQGLVFLNIPSYMAGTNFWGTDREKRGFSAPSYDDKLVEVVGVTGITQVTTAKVLGIQNQRIAQCRYAKITIRGPDTLPMQVDGEAWLQAPGIIVVSHKNKARIIFKDKTFSQSLESWKLKNPVAVTLPVCPLHPVGLLDYLTVEEVERYQKTAKTTRALMELIRHEGASGNADVSHDLVPLVASTSSTLDRVFPEDCVSETADLQHLEDFKHDLGALVEEAIYALDKKKISSSRVEKMAECVRSLKAHVDAISSSESSTAGVFRRASDSAVVRPSSSSPSAHRERSACMIQDPTLTATSIAKKTGREVWEWECNDVCWWMGELGLKEYDELIHSKDITGKVLLEMQPKDFQELGITKMGHLTKLRSGVQALSYSLYTSPRTTKCSRQFRETR